MNKYALVEKYDNIWSTRKIGTLQAVLLEAERLLSFGITVQIVPI